MKSKQYQRHAVPYRVYTVLAIPAMILACIILLISFQHANVNGFEGQMNRDQHILEKVVDGIVLPGHPKYFVDRFFDRVHFLTVRSKTEKVALCMRYGSHRVEISDILFLRGEHRVAIDVASKGVMYYGLAGQIMMDEKLQSQFRPDQYLELYAHLDQAIDTIQVRKSLLSDQQKAQADQLLNYASSLQAGLRGFIDETPIVE